MIFEGIDPLGQDTVRAAAEVIIARRDNLGLGHTPWSLAELRPDSADYAWLLRWARGLDSVYCATYLGGGVVTGGLTRRAALGLLLLFLASEHGRREASEGQIWPSVLRIGFRPRTESLLFFGVGQPTQDHKDALEVAARRLNLRHVFGIEGLQNWFDTIFLQFGFTRRGFVRRLPYWLAGQGQPQSIRRLLAPGPLGSAGFLQVWNRIRDFRQNNITEVHLRQAIVQTAWILPEWVNEVVLQACRHPELGTAAAARTIHDLRTQPFLTPPRLAWLAPGPPLFECSLVNLAALDLPADVYRLQAAGRLIGSLVRQPDGAFARVGFDEVQLKPASPQVSAQLLLPDGTPANSVVLELWGQGEDVSVFRMPNGARVQDPWNEPLSPASAYALVLADDLRPNPQPAMWHDGGHGWRFWLLPPGWSPSFKVFLGEEVLWEPRLGDGPAGEPAWAQDVWASVRGATTVRVGSPFQVDIQHGTEIQVHFARFGGVPLPLEDHAPTVTVAGPVHFSGTLLRENPQIRIGVQHGRERRTLRQNVWIDPAGVARLGADGWEALGPLDSLSAESARGSLFRIYPPPAFAQARDLAVLEGDTWVGRVKADPSPLGRLGGWGARLTVRQGPYNATEEVLAVSEEVTAPGVVSDVDLWTDPGRVRVKLTDALEPGPGHRLVWWAEDGEVATSDVSAEVAEDGGVWWSGDIPGQDPPIIAAALAYSSEEVQAASRIGAWWADTWADSLAEAGDDDAPFLAAMMRWFHLPVLSARALLRVQAFVQEFPAESLAAWLLEDSPAEDLAMPSLDESWLSAVRSLFWDWRPSADQAHAVLLSLAQTAELDEEAVCRAGTRLHRADPLLLCRVMGSWFRGYLVPARGAPAATAYLASLLVCIGELPSLAALEATANAMLSSVAETLAVAPNFVEVGLLQRARQHLLGHPVEARDRFNLGLAMGVEPFRRLLVLRLLPLALPGD